MMRYVPHMEGSETLTIKAHKDLVLRLRKASRREGIPEQEMIMKSLYAYLAVSEAAFLDHKYVDHFTPKEDQS